MSEAVTPLNGARFEGLATIADAGLTGMITLRGDLSSAEVKAALLDELEDELRERLMAE